MKRFNAKNVFALMVLIGSLFTLFGCGSSSTSSGATSTGTINGMAVKGPVSGATVTAYEVSDGMQGTALASAITDSIGNYHISIGSYSGPVMLVMSGGTYTDEATGAIMTMSPGDVMTAVIPSVSTDETGSTIQITPVTSMAQIMAGNLAGGMTGTNIAAANTAIGNYFMVSDILHTMPMNPLVNNSGAGSTTDQKNYGMALAAMSQYAMNMGLSSSSGMVTALMDDASDGVLDGMMGNTPITLGTGTMLPSTATSGMATAMQQFMQSSMNRSGLQLSDMQTLMNSMSTSSGQLMGGMGGMISGGTGTTSGMMTGGTGTTDGMMTGGTSTTSGMMTGGTGSTSMMSGSL